MRQEILAAAHDALDEAGAPSRMRLGAIARRLGISAPAIYAHFRDKEDLLHALAKDALEDLCCHFESADRAGHDLSLVGAAYIAYALRQPAHYRSLS